VRTGSFSKGNIADGIALSSWAEASEERIAGISAAGSIEHNSRRETDMISPLAAFGIFFKEFKQMQAQGV
jgi:hypothetical protein